MCGMSAARSDPADGARRRRLATAFEAAFGGRPTHVARAPGRVNLIGEHVDYHGGPVLPQSLALDTRVAFRAVPADRVDLRTTAVGVEPAWQRYPDAMLAVLRERGVPVAGFEGVVDSALPIGAGLSSSAALLVAVGLALTSAAGEAVGAARLAELARDAEHRTGVASGAMDFVAALFGRVDGPIRIDCADGAIAPVPGPPPSHRWAVVSSGMRHELAASAYNARVAECRAALATLRDAGVTDADRLADVGADRLPTVARVLDDLGTRRVRHVVTECARVDTVVAALERGDVGAVGAALRASHRSLRDDYAVSVPAVDALVDAIGVIPGVAGVRMTGGGFGGSLVALVGAGTDDALAACVARHPGATLIDPAPGPAASVTPWVA